MNGQGGRARGKMVFAGLLAGTAVAGCGGGASFTPTTPVSDVCSLLTLADARTVLATATAGAERVSLSNTDYWSRNCTWMDSNPTGTEVQLVVYGALTSQGKQELDFGVTMSAALTSTPLSGVGDRATFWYVDASYQGESAEQGDMAVDVTGTLLAAPATAAELTPLVTKVLGEL